MTVVNNVSKEAANAASGTFEAALFQWGNLPIPVIDTFLGPLLIIVAALLAWARQMHVMRRRATFDYITNHLLDPKWLDQHNAAIIALKNCLSSEELCKPIAKRWSDSKLTDDDRDLLGPVLTYLNHLEFAAIGLHAGTRTLDQKLYAAAWGIPFIQAWQRAEHFIKAMHDTPRGDDFLCNFHDVAQSPSFRRVARWHDKYSAPSALTITRRGCGQLRAR